MKAKWKKTTTSIQLIVVPPGRHDEMESSRIFKVVTRETFQWSLQGHALLTLVMTWNDSSIHVENGGGVVLEHSGLDGLIGPR